MSYACAPILVGVVSPVSEILILSKTAKFSFRTMDYSPWSSKNWINRNWLKKFMHVGLNVKCMHSNFGGHGLPSVGDIATFKFGKFGYFQFSLLYIIINYYKWYGNAVSWLCHMHSPLKERTDRNWLKRVKIQHQAVRTWQKTKGKQLIETTPISSIA